MVVSTELYVNELGLYTFDVIMRDVYCSRLWKQLIYHLMN